MSELYDVLRERLKMRPMVALRWIYGPKDLHELRFPSFMDERRRVLRLKTLSTTIAVDASKAIAGVTALAECFRRVQQELIRTT